MAKTKTGPEEGQPAQATGVVAPVEGVNTPTQDTLDPRPRKARALVDVKLGEVVIRSGHLVEADAETIAALADQVDTHPDAVAYCEKITNG